MDAAMVLSATAVPEAAWHHWLSQIMAWLWYDVFRPEFIYHVRHASRGFFMEVAKYFFGSAWTSPAATNIEGTVDATRSEYILKASDGLPHSHSVHTHWPRYLDSTMHEVKHVPIAVPTHSVQRNTLDDAELTDTSAQHHDATIASRAPFLGDSEHTFDHQQATDPLKFEQFRDASNGWYFQHYDHPPLLRHQDVTTYGGEHVSIAVPTLSTHSNKLFDFPAGFLLQHNDFAIASQYGVPGYARNVSIIAVQWCQCNRDGTGVVAPCTSNGVLIAPWKEECSSVQVIQRLCTAQQQWNMAPTTTTSISSLVCQVRDLDHAHCRPLPSKCVKSAGVSGSYEKKVPDSSDATHQQQATMDSSCCQCVRRHASSKLTPSWKLWSYVAQTNGQCDIEARFLYHTGRSVLATPFSTLGCPSGTAISRLLPSCEADCSWHHGSAGMAPDCTDVPRTTGSSPVGLVFGAAWHSFLIASARLAPHLLGIGHVLWNNDTVCQFFADVVAAAVTMALLAASAYGNVQLVHRIWAALSAMAACWSSGICETGSAAVSCMSDPKTLKRLTLACGVSASIAVPTLLGLALRKHLSQQLVVAVAGILALLLVLAVVWSDLVCARPRILAGMLQAPAAQKCWNIIQAAGRHIGIPNLRQMAGMPRLRGSESAQSSHSALGNRNGHLVIPAGLRKGIPAIAAPRPIEAESAPDILQAVAAGDGKMQASLSLTNAIFLQQHILEQK